MMRRALTLLLSFALLSGWQAALLHPLVHADSHGGLVHLPTPAGDKPDYPAKTADCAALAALASCISTAAAATTGASRPVLSFALPVPQPAPLAASVAYRSQAPPLFS